MKHKLFTKLTLSGFLLVLLSCLTINHTQAQSTKARGQKSTSGKAVVSSDLRLEQDELQKASQPQIMPAQPGTYQILAKDAQSHEVFPVDILLEIEKNRDQDKVVFLKAGESSVIKILPYRELQSKKFVPLPEFGVQE